MRSMTSSRSRARSVSTSMRSLSTRASRTVISDTMPVRPMPPAVAANSSGSAARVTVRRSPSGATSPKASTCAEKAPSAWWFLPWTSAASAPPSVTWLLPGITRGTQPWGRASRARSPRLRPAPAATVPRSRSNARTAVRAVVSTTVPPAFWAASPYARPTPRAISPPPPPAASASASSAGSWGRRSVARVGAVRPQPVSSASAGSATEVDTAGEHDHPRERARPQAGIAEDEVLGGAVAVVLREHRVAHDEQDERDDRELHERRAVEGARAVERPEAVGGEGHGGGCGAEVAQVAVAVVRERRAGGGAGVAELGVLARPLAGDDEQRAERGDDQEPAGEWDVRREAAGDGPDDEERGDRRDVEDRQALEVDRVREGQRGVAGYGGEQRQGDERADGQAGGEQPEAAHEGGPAPDLARGDRPVPLGGMPAVALGVAQVVEEVAAARGEAEGDEGQRHRPERVGVGEDTGRRRRGQHQQVLEPLARTGCGDERPCARAARARRRRGPLDGRTGVARGGMGGGVWFQRGEACTRCERPPSSAVGTLGAERRRPRETDDAQNRSGPGARGTRSAGPAGEHIPRLV